jgi:hypothetical protein
MRENNEQHGDADDTAANGVGDRTTVSVGVSIPEFPGRLLTFIMTIDSGAVVFARISKFIWNPPGTDVRVTPWTINASTGLVDAMLALIVAEEASYGTGGVTRVLPENVLKVNEYEPAVALTANTATVRPKAVCMTHDINGVTTLVHASLGETVPHIHKHVRTRHRNFGTIRSAVTTGAPKPHNGKTAPTAQ